MILILSSREKSNRKLKNKMGLHITVKSVSERKTNMKTIVNHFDDESLTSRDVSAILRCSLPTARDVMKRPDFPLLRIGRRLCVLRSAFFEWAKHRRI